MDGNALAEGTLPPPAPHTGLQERLQRRPVAAAEGSVLHGGPGPHHGGDVLRGTAARAGGAQGQTPTAGAGHTALWGSRVGTPACPT